MVVCMVFSVAGEPGLILPPVVPLQPPDLRRIHPVDAYETDFPEPWIFGRSDHIPEIHLRQSDVAPHLLDVPPAQFQDRELYAGSSSASGARVVLVQQFQSGPALVREKLPSDDPQDILARDPWNLPHRGLTTCRTAS